MNSPPETAFDMPTPAQETQTMGQWTLSTPLGKGRNPRLPQPNPLTTLALRLGGVGGAVVG